MSSATFFQIQSFVILILLFLGAFTASKNKHMHAKLMKGAILWDIILVLQIEFSRQAIAKAYDTIHNPLILNVHIAMALITILLYFAMIYSGRKILIAKNNYRLPRHRKMGYLVLTLRTLTFATSFFIVSNP